jgi:hypothetical protein
VRGCGGVCSQKGGGGWEAAVGDACDEGADGCGVGVGLLHGFEVELEVADGATVELVGLFAEDDLVDEAAAFGKGFRNPRNRDAGELRLQGFEEGHEVPDSEDVRLHEEAEMMWSADAGVERVAGEAGAERGDAGFDVFDGGGANGCGHTSIIAGVEG